MYTKNNHLYLHTDITHLIIGRHKHTKTCFWPLPPLSWILTTQCILGFSLWAVTGKTYSNTKCVLDRLALSYSHASNPTKPKLRVRLFKSLTNLTALWLFFCAKAWEHWLQKGRFIEGQAQRQKTNKHQPSQQGQKLKCTIWPSGLPVQRWQTLSITD